MRGWSMEGGGWSVSTLRSTLHPHPPAFGGYPATPVVQMKKHFSAIAIAFPFAMLCSCNATGDERVYDTTRPSPVTPTQTVAPDSTTGVARSSGRPGVAGD